jgi:hypothetical protein
VPFHLGEADIHPVDPRASGPHLEPPEELLDPVRVPLSVGLDAAVLEVSNPAFDLECSGLEPRVPAESDALHPPLEEDPAGFHGAWAHRSTGASSGAPTMPEWTVWSNGRLAMISPSSCLS